METLLINSNPEFTVNVVTSNDTIELSVGNSYYQKQLLSAVNPTVDVEIIAYQDMGLYRATTILGVYCEPTYESLSEYAGITRFAVIAGNRVKVTKFGLITENSWSWTPNAPIFVGNSGMLSQSFQNLPVRRIGYAVSPTQINLDPFFIIGA